MPGLGPVCARRALPAPHEGAAGRGAWLEIRAPGVSSKNRYVHGVRLNGRPWTKAYLTYDDLRQGGVLEFDMRPTPDRRRRFRGEERPYSLSAEL